MRKVHKISDKGMSHGDKSDLQKSQAEKLASEDESKYTISEKGMGGVFTDPTRNRDGSINQQSTTSFYQRVVKDCYAQMSSIDKYALSLGKSKRFQNVKGPLYDTTRGWNPGYRVLASDLMSPIPLEPFEKMHKKADVPFGQPS